MVIVFETWTLKAGLEDCALKLMQKMDDLVGPPAHEHPGWCGHATFYQSRENLLNVLVVYPWRSRQLHEHLTEQEEPLLADFQTEYCAEQRRIDYYDLLPVEVEPHDDKHSEEGEP